MQTNFCPIDLASLSTKVPTLIYGDALQIMGIFPNDYFDLIIDDCGYTDLKVHRSKGTTTRFTVSNGSSNEFYEDNVDYEKTLPRYHKLLKKGRHLYIWRPSLNEESLHNWCNLIQPATGLLNSNSFRFRKSIVCKKSYSGLGYSFRSSQERIIVSEHEPDYEEIVFSYNKGVMRKLKLMALEDIFTDKWKHPAMHDKVHTSEKPPSIIHKLIDTSTEQGELILEPFAGSFPSGFANCKFGLARRVIGMESSKKIFHDTVDHFRSNGYELNLLRYRPDKGDVIKF